MRDKQIGRTKKQETEELMKKRANKKANRRTLDK